MTLVTLLTKTYKRSDSAIPWFTRPAPHIALVSEWSPARFTETATEPDEFTLVVVRTYTDLATATSWVEQAGTIETERQRKVYEDLNGISWTKVVHDGSTNTTTTTTSKD